MIHAIAYMHETSGRNLCAMWLCVYAICVYILHIKRWCIVEK